jgi:hypothetical protein
MSAHEKAQIQGGRQVVHRFLLEREAEKIDASTLVEVVLGERSGDGR